MKDGHGAIHEPHKRAYKCWQGFSVWCTDNLLDNCCNCRWNFDMF